MYAFKFLKTVSINMCMRESDVIIYLQKRFIRENITRFNLNGCQHKKVLEYRGGDEKVMGFGDDGIDCCI